MTQPREALLSPALLHNAYRRIVQRVEFDTNGGCWLWPGAVQGTYGGIKIRPFTALFAVHRITHWHDKGPIPEDLLACHHCDVRTCCNPSHVFAGTQSENIKDAVRKGRHGIRIRNRLIRGELHPFAALTDEDIRAINILHAQGFRAPYLALRFGVTEGHVFKVLRGDARATH
jgi:hypothetical protein